MVWALGFSIVVVTVRDNNDWTLRLKIHNNTQLCFYCRRIVVIINSNVIIGSVWYGHWGSLLSFQQYATITTVKMRGTLWLTTRDNTQLGSYCRRIVAIVNSNVIIRSAWFGHWGSLLSLPQYATITTMKLSGTLWLTIHNNTQLGSYCRRIVPIVNSNVIVGSAWYGHWGSLLSLRQHETITTVKLRGTLWLTIRDNTQLSSYCRRIVAIITSNVIIGLAWYGHWVSLLSLRQFATITTGYYS